MEHFDRCHSHTKQLITKLEHMANIMNQLGLVYIITGSHCQQSTRLQYCLHGPLPGPFLLSYSIFNFFSFIFRFWAVR